MGEFISPKLTTIGIDHILWGKQVAGAIIDIVTNQKVKDIGHPKGLIIIRESC